MPKKRTSKTLSPQKKRKPSLKGRWLGQAHLYEPSNPKLRNRSS